MRWVVQNNLGGLDDVEFIRKACEAYGYDFWGERYRISGSLLNDDYRITTLNKMSSLKEVDAAPQRFFVRPVADNKAFSGQLFYGSDILEWRKKIIEGQHDILNIPIIVSTPKTITKEYRLFFVDGKMSSASQYRYMGRLKVDSNVPETVVLWAEGLVCEYG
jgi:hypothetical protein